MTAVPGAIAGLTEAEADELERCRAQLRSSEVPDVELCARLAELHARAGSLEEACRWAVRSVDAPPSFGAWRRAVRVLDAACPCGAPDARRTARVALLGTATLTPLLGCLRLALARARIGAELYEAPFGQYWQETMDQTAALRDFAPDVVVFVPDHRAAIPLDGDAAWDLEVELARWTAPWAAIRRWSAADVVQVSFVEPEIDPFGTAAAARTGSRRSRLRALDRALAEAAADAGVVHVDAESLAGAIGKRQWFDLRYWYAARHPFSMAVAPELAVRIAGAVAARWGLAKRGIILDLDDTLWRGVVGDDGVHGIELSGPRGEAMVELQHALRAFSRRGIVLAACSKNEEAIARQPFEERTDMVLGLDDFAAFVASWQPKPASIRDIARQLGLPLDAFVFVDDNAVERESVRRALPEVDVLALSDDPTRWLDDLARYPWLEPGTVTDDDQQRVASYRARAAAAELAAEVSSIEELHRSLEMRATLEPIGEHTLDRAVQLIAKTNQFNLTARRHPVAAVGSMVADPDWVHLTARLVDRFADHGVVAVVLAQHRNTRLDIDTLVMSCRVIGRGLETVLLAAIAEQARRHGLATLRGRYVPTERNGLVADLWRDHGFTLLSSTAAESIWELDLAEQPTWRTEITVEDDR